MFLVIDNYDSFVHNLARYFELAGAEVAIARNDALTIEDIRTLKPEGLILSPGPCSPKEAGICVEAVKILGPEMPILGVCLGHQCIGEAYGAMILRALSPLHGKARAIRHDASGVFSGLPTPFKVGRYHSLIVGLTPQCPLKINAKAEDNGEIMGLQHPLHPVHGVQFHPESILTEHGLAMVNNFISIAVRWHKERRSDAA